MDSGARRCGTLTAYVSCFFAITTQMVLVALLFSIATKGATHEHSLRGITWAAGTVHVLAVFALLGTTLLFTRRIGTLSQSIAVAIAILLSILALLLSIYSFTQYRSESQPLVQNLTYTGFAMWSLAVVAQAVFYFLLLWPAPTTEDHTSSEGGTKRSSPTRFEKSRISIQLSGMSPPRMAHFAQPPPPSPYIATAPPPSSPRSSIRHSMDHVIRPMTSKTRLLLQKARDSYSLCSERKQSLDTIGQEDDFGDWDTTGPNEISFPQEAYIQEPARTRLETIPGSRPVSPAKALDGPFRGDSLDVQLEPEARANHFSDAIFASLSTSPPSETNSLRNSIRSVNGTNIDTSQVHPLFRSDSPHPPPTASPSTEVHASVHGGQVWTRDPSILGPRVLHSAQSTRADSPGPGRSRQNSFASSRFQQVYTPDEDDLPPPLPTFSMATSGKT